MRQRAFIHVGGPPGAGKTTLVETVLAHTDRMIIAARCVRDAFFITSLMENFSHAVMLEGDNPVGFVDVAAYVAPVTVGRLPVGRKSDQPSSERAALDALEAVLRQPGGLDLLLGRLIVGRVAEVGMQNPELVEQEQRNALTQLNELRSTPVPRNRMRRAIADPPSQWNTLRRTSLTALFGHRFSCHAMFE